MRKILVPIRGDGKGESLLSHAMMLARRFNAHIEAIHARPRGGDMLPEGMFVPQPLRKELEGAARDFREQEVTRLRGLFDDYVAASGVEVIEADTVPAADRPTLSWADEIGKQRDVVAECGCLADIIVVAKPDRGTGLGTGTIEAALIEAGRLMMLCPPAKPVSLGERISIGWNGSAECGRAVSNTLPLLAQAQTVTILCDETQQSVSSGSLALRDYLSLHGIEAHIEIVKSGADGMGEPLLRAAGDNDSDALVIGAYGDRSRRRKMLLGDVTAHVIEQTMMPVLMTL